MSDQTPSETTQSASRLGQEKRSFKDLKYVKSFFCVFLSSMLFANGAWAIDNIADNGTAKTAAVGYLRSLPGDQKIYVWPLWCRPCEVISNRLDIKNSIERYKSLRGSLNGLTPTFLIPIINVAQISIIAGDGSNWQKDLASSLAGSHLLPGYKDFVAKAPVSSNGCTSYRFIDRDTWASVGVVLVNQKALLRKDEDGVDKCLHAALDYIQGFPTKDGYFDYLDLPDATIRGVIIEAIYRCASEPGGSGKPDESSRDGLSPLPSLDCIEKNISE